MKAYLHGSTQNVEFQATYTSLYYEEQGPIPQPSGVFL